MFQIFGNLDLLVKSYKRLFQKKLTRHYGPRRWLLLSISKCIFLANLCWRVRATPFVAEKPAVISFCLDDGDGDYGDYCDYGDADNGDDDVDDDDDGVDGVWTAANNPALFGLSVSVLWMCVSLSDTHTHARTQASTRAQTRTNIQIEIHIGLHVCWLKYTLLWFCVYVLWTRAYTHRCTHALKDVGSRTKFPVDWNPHESQKNCRHCVHLGSNLSWCQVINWSRAKS